MSLYITPEKAAEALDSLDDYARMDIGVDAHGPRKVLEQFIKQYTLLTEANTKLMGENANQLGQKLMYQKAVENIKERGQEYCNYLDDIINTIKNWEAKHSEAE